MDRRDLLSALGAFGAGFAAMNGRTALAHGHEKPSDAGDKFTMPLQSIHAHFCGIHVAKNNPKIQIVAQHYCGPRSEEMHQCLLFDSYEKNAKLLGVEYIVSDRIYQDLSDTEKQYWHPHTYEVLAGGLVAPGMSEGDELKFMKAIISTWGKTWHTWPDPTTDVPLGEPLLMWALTGDGQSDESVIAKRDELLRMSTPEVRRKRAAEFGLKVPQVPQPKSRDQIGRQWTAEGADKPSRLKP